MRTLTYAILGILLDKDMTGYDIQNEFKGDLGEFWTTTHSQIYPELKKLTDEGLITFETVIQGNVMEKKLYKITEDGKNVLYDWLLGESKISENTRDEFVLKTFFSHSLNKSEKQMLFKNQLNIKKEKLNKLIERLNEFPDDITKKLDEYPALFTNYLVLKRAIGREEAYIKWLKELISIYK